MTNLINWAIMLILWFGLFLFSKKKGLDNNLPPSVKKTYSKIIYLYPLIGTVLKITILSEIIPYSWFFLNRLEHFFWSASLVVITLPIFIKVYKAKPWFLGLFFALGLASFLGNLNEFLEYFIRFDWVKNWYYSDTIFDEMTNVVGGLAAWGFVSSLLQKDKKPEQLDQSETKR